LKDSIGLKNIVITHHAPSIKSVPEKYKNISVTAAYASNLENFILEHQQCIGFMVIFILLVDIRLEILKLFVILMDISMKKIMDLLKN
jgi:hypothetical protein